MPDFLSIGPFTGDARLDRLFDSFGRFRDLAGIMATGAILDAGIKGYGRRGRKRKRRTAPNKQDQTSDNALLGISLWGGCLNFLFFFYIPNHHARIISFFFHSSGFYD